MANLKNTPTLPSDTGSPLYQHLRDQIRQRIYSGELPRGQQLPTEAQLTRQYDVSNITVRRAMQELVAEGLLIRSPGKGTFVNPSPFTATYNLLFVHSLELSFDYPYTGLIFKGISKANQPAIQFRLETLGLPPRLTQDGEDQRVLELVEHDQIHGILAMPFIQHETLAELAEKIPVVQLGYISKPIAGVTTIRYALRPAILDVALQRCAETQRKHVGIITEPDPGQTVLGQSIPDALAEHGYTPDPDRIRSAPWGLNGGHQAASELLRDHPDIDAILAADDMQALGAITAVHAAGKTPGKDVAVIGVGNLLGDHSHAQLTTIDQQIEYGAQLGAQTLLDLLRGKKRIRKEIPIEPKLIVRQTG